MFGLAEFLVEGIKADEEIGESNPPHLSGIPRATIGGFAPHLREVSAGLSNHFEGIKRKAAELVRPPARVYW